jgi:proteasome assembly chaperone (PAC2) family protein
MTRDDRQRYITYDARPVLRNPILIAAFEGWNDAAEAASSALEYLQETWDAPRLAAIDPEEFYDFTETRPTVRLAEGGGRELDWPDTEFFYHVDPARSRDLILLAGVEPQLHWRTYSRVVLDVAIDFGVSTFITLGALLAEVPHARPSRVTVSATDEALRRRLGQTAARGSRYEGPTGILSVLQDTCSRAGIAGASLWGHAPHYLSASPNPQVTLAILRRLDSLLDLRLDLHELADEAESFVAQVNEAVSHDPEATSYLHMLEAQDEEDDEAETDSFHPPSRGPSTGGLIQDVEEFLRRRRGDEG